MITMMILSTKELIIGEDAKSYRVESSICKNVDSYLQHKVMGDIFFFSNERDFLSIIEYQIN